ncbi:MAG: LamG domain-containing protein [Pirellulales bacterium]
MDPTLKGHGGLAPPFGQPPLALSRAAALLSIIFPLVSAAPAPAALIGHWKCQDNAASTTVVATVGTNGTLTGAGNTSASSIAGPGRLYPLALVLDGVNDYIDCNSNHSMNNLVNCSITAWVYRPSSGSQQTVGPQNSGNKFNIHWNNSNNFTGQLNFQAISIAKNETGWHHLAFTFNGAATSGGTPPKGKLYYDGMAQSTSDITTLTAIGNNMGNFMIGRDNGTAYSSGRFADVRVYNQTLTESEVKVIMFEGSARPANYYHQQSRLERDRRQFYSAIGLDESIDRRLLP